MEQVIRNMNFKPLIDEIKYDRLDAPTNNAKINMQIWDEIKVERLRSDAVKVILTRAVEPQPKMLFSIKVTISMEVLINTSAYDALDDAVEYFKNTQVMQALCGHASTIISQITTHSPVGPMITAPVLMLAK